MTVEPSADSLLWERLRAGDDEAFTAFYLRHARYIAGVVYRLVGQDEMLDDMVQETFVDAARAIGKLSDPARVRPWLATIAVRHVHRYLGRRGRARVNAEQLAQAAPPSSDPEGRERIVALYRALDDVDPELRVPWVLHHVEGHTLPEVAELCDTSLATIKRRIARAEERLGRRLHG